METLSSAFNEEYNDNQHQPPLKIVATGSSLEALSRLSDLVVNFERSYEDVAEQIEDRAYELCEKGSLGPALAQLERISDFFEQLEGKNEEQCRDLADIYLLIGQIHQFAGQFEESITWFSRSSIVDDRYHAPYHSLAMSYIQLHEYEKAVKSLEEEIILAPGNYYSYLLLADLYEREERTEAVETCLIQLLERDPENIQGLHHLIRHYEQNDDSIDTTLLKRRLMGVSKSFNRIEAVIRSYYLNREGRYTEVIDFVDRWSSGANGATITCLVKAFVYSEMRQYSRRRQMLTRFKMCNHGRKEVMLAKLREFGAVFGEEAAEELQRLLMLPPAER